ncbi:SLBB domain-containing protein [Sandaracinobacteroides saxicola]|uniref:SLBB domain-containing protein n=1 Tax=Sandaracinobacteroides saxicola TaxID=2759707 RepID=A0A7G5IKS1_9SPHN|nr:SLBB domain-containing protein [Sandaracinobacteroides saxicola]QMW23963.1 SLBB domain-containing protein [Sandaracinobacteroides saxicola]
MVGTALPAQSIDPSVLEGLQGRLGGRINPSDLLDSSRGVQSQVTPPQTPGGVITSTGRVDTVEEQLLRRAEARKTLETLYQPSAVEKDYRQRLRSSNLRQFGYELFQQGAPPTGTLTGSVGDDYVLGIGDELVVNFQGATNETKAARVSRDGMLIVGSLRPVQAAGRTVGSVRAALAAETRRTLLATEIYLSVGTVRAVSVFVGGEVERPGQYSLTSLADVMTAIANAGGVRRTGTLRNVRVVRGGATLSVDLYGYLGIGAPSAVRLRDGDRVIVPVIGPTVAVTGSVARPGIYELRGPASVAAVLGFAGGSLRQRGGEVVISRIAPDGSESFTRANAMKAGVLGGDIVSLVAGSSGGQVGRVALFGNVDNPGARALGSTPTLSDLVGSPADLRSDTYQLAAILLRRDPATGARQFETVNLAAALRMRPSMRLRSDDELFVFSKADIAFLNGAAVRRVALGQQNPLPDCVSLSRLAGLVRDTQSSRFNVVTRGGFVVERAGQSDIGGVGGVLATGGNRRTTEALAERTLSEAEQKGSCPEIFEQEPDLLPVLIENAVSVGGAVRRPGAYPVGGAVSARDLAVVADGLVGGSSGLQLDIMRVGGQAEHGDGSAPDALTLARVGPGDDIRFNAAQPMFEGSGVLLAGEVARPGLYAIRKGETLGQLMARAGGLTNLAYAYGTVFTRRSVKEQQQEGFRRTARELNNSLLAVSARKQTAESNLAGAAALIQTLATTEAPGRVVVEADPGVLARRPDLDTVLEPGDAVFVPKRPNFVLALGDVNNPSALQYVNGKDAAAYLREAGGTLSTADKDRVFAVLPNGTALPVRSGRWSRSGGLALPPGTTIIVPKNIDPLYRLDVIRDITTIIASLATSIGTVAILATR